MTLSSVERLEAPAQSLQPLPRSTSTLTMFCDTDRAAQARRINLNCPTFERSVYVLHDVYIKFRERSGKALCNQAQLRPRPSIRMSAHNKIHFISDVPFSNLVNFLNLLWCSARAQSTRDMLKWAGTICV